MLLAPIVKTFMAALPKFLKRAIKSTLAGWGLTRPRTYFYSEGKHQRTEVEEEEEEEDKSKEYSRECLEIIEAVCITLFVCVCVCHLL